MEPWILAALLRFAPLANLPQFPGHEETPDESRARYVLIARAIQKEAEAPEAKPDGLTDRQEAALLIALAIGESGLAKDADVGPCHRKGAWRTRCDSGQAASVWQVHAFGEGPDGTKITLAGLFASRRLAAWQALRVARSSLGLCRRLPPEDRLSGLSGRCQDGPGPWRARWRLWQTIQAWKEPKT
jgi:hypothetical protein